MNVALKRFLLVLVLLPTALIICLRRTDGLQSGLPFNNQPIRSVRSAKPDFEQVTRNYPKVHVGLTEHDVEMLFGPPDQVEANPLMKQIEEHVRQLTGPMSIPPSANGWRQWRDPEDHERWVAINFGCLGSTRHVVVKIKHRHGSPVEISAE